jgi:hypothetical protein
VSNDFYLTDILAGEITLTNHANKLFGVVLLLDSSFALFFTFAGESNSGYCTIQFWQ